MSQGMQAAPKIWKTWGNEFSSRPCNRALQTPWHQCQTSDLRNCASLTLDQCSSLVSSLPLFYISPFIHALILSLFYFIFLLCLFPSLFLSTPTPSLSPSLLPLPPFSQKSALLPSKAPFYAMGLLCCLVKDFSSAFTPSPSVVISLSLSTRSFLLTNKNFFLYPLLRKGKRLFLDLDLSLAFLPSQQSFVMYCLHSLDPFHNSTHFD